MDLKLTGKRALVTGSSRGLGYATALALAKEAAWQKGWKRIGKMEM
jgi:3-oxoacyl-[acyl-carrier protein] reductase